MRIVVIVSLISLATGQLLDCNFDQQSFCRWLNALNGVEDDFDWRIDNTAAIDGFHSIPRTVTGTGYFAYAQGKFRPTETEAAKAWLMSPVINGLSNPAALNFVFWKTAAPPILQVCIRDSGSSVLRCLDTVSGLGDPKWVQRTLTIPSNSLPFQIIFVALGFRTALDLIGIDEITVRYADGEQLGRLIEPGAPAAYPQQTESPVRQYSPGRAEAPGRYQPAPLPAWQTPGYAQTQRPNYQTQPFQYNVVPTESYQRTQPPFVPTLPLYNIPPFPPPTQPSQIYQAGIERNPPNQGQSNLQQPSRIAAPHDEQTPAIVVVPAHPQLTTNSHRQVEGSSIPPFPFNVEVNTNPPPRNIYNTVNPNENSNFISLNPVQPGIVDVFEPKASASFEATTHNFAHYFTTTSHSPHLYFTTTTERLAVRVDPSETVSGQCSAVTCPFNKDFCKWYNDLSSNFDWKLKYAPVPYQGAGYIFVTGDFRKLDQRASIKSPSFVVPSDSFLEFLAFLSDPNAGRLGVYVDDSANPNNLLWKATGHKSMGGSGWRRIRVALPVSSFPVTMSFVADQLTTGHYIGIDDVRLTDKSGFDLGCASDAAFPEEQTKPPTPISLDNFKPTKGFESLETKIAKISEAPIREASAFSQSRPNFIFVNPTPKIHLEPRTDIFDQSSFTRIPVRKLPELDDESSRPRASALRPASVFGENPLKEDALVDKDDFSSKSNFIKFYNITDKQLNLQKVKPREEDDPFSGQTVPPINQSSPSITEQSFASTNQPQAKPQQPTNPDPLGVKDFILQISKDLRGAFGAPATQPLFPIAADSKNIGANNNNLFNFPFSLFKK